ncbi:B-cell CLL/lymphoma 6 member B protein isoform X2 [Chlorocebus sabaeus]|uniref:B-cell CLL/lymphoma 6 member B protein isoform X2 n=1 Tax=Chlorocebus sabaeus TaxID=60711 RepID=UPI0018B0C366|nr:B-cell CLL/lymphoma 6 member B protein isoform X2 [Chlorocebus sabaeus]
MGSPAAPEGALGYVREFTRHSSDVLGNLNELRLRGILTDVTLLVGGQPLRAHKAVLIACSGFFYSIFRGRAGVGVDVLSLPGGPEARGFAPLLDFMYTSRLRLSPATAPAVLAAATYLQMEHVVQACHRFIQASYEPLGISLRPLEAEPPTPPTAPPPGSPRRSEGHPDPPTESRSCSQGPPSPASPDPKACNWKKLSPTAATVQFKCGAPASTPHLLTSQAQDTSGSPSERARPLPGSEFFSCQNCEAVAGCSSGLDPLVPGDEDKPYKCQLCRSSFRYKGNLASHRTVHTGEKPYHCSICGARFNRPANLKTHSRIHSGEKPYKCETCGSRFVQVAHLRAHVLIHTGEKPYPCPTCGTRFRHLQTLKSHVRIHTGEKPYHCDPCGLHFRHKSQLRLHLRQKHGAATNTKVHYHILGGP